MTVSEEGLDSLAKTLGTGLKGGSKTEEGKGNSVQVKVGTNNKNLKTGEKLLIDPEDESKQISADMNDVSKCRQEMWGNIPVVTDSKGNVVVFNGVLKREGRVSTTSNSTN